MHHKSLVIIKKPKAKRKKGGKKETDKCFEHDTTVAGATITYRLFDRRIWNDPTAQKGPTHRGFLRSLFAAGYKRWSVVRARACSREVSCGRFFAIGIYRSRRLHSRRNCFRLWALRCEVSLKFDANLIPVMLYAIVLSLLPLHQIVTAQYGNRNVESHRFPMWNLLRVFVSRYTNVVGDINAISWNRFRYISLLLFVALFLPWFLFLFLRCFFSNSERRLTG